MSVGGRLVLWLLVGATLQVGPAQPYATIGDALGDAAPGDVIEVDPGTYEENLTVGFDLTLRGVGGAGVTSLRARSEGPIVRHTSARGGRPTLRIEGLTLAADNDRTCVVALSTALVLEDAVLEGCGGYDLTGLYADGATVTLRRTTASGPDGGSTVWVEDTDLTVQDASFRDAVAWQGAFVHAEGGTVAIERSVFRNGFAWDDGGAVSLWGCPATLVDDEFTGNFTYGDGGAVSVEWGPSASVTGGVWDENGAGVDGGAFYTYAVDDVLVDGGTWTYNSCYDDGGAVAIEGANAATVRRGVWQRNTAGWGGALSVAYSLASEVAGNLSCRNVAREAGGAIELWGERYEPSAQHHQVHHNVFDKDEATWGAVLVLGFGDGLSETWNNTFADPAGGAWRAESYGTHASWNNVFAHSADGVPVWQLANYASWDVRYNLLFDATAPDPDPRDRSTRVEADPVFLDLHPTGCGSDLRTGPGSPVVDAGDPAGAPDDDGSRADLGAYGGYGAAALLDLDGDGVIDGDCAPSDAAVHPGAEDLAADGVDQDCDGAEPCWVDADGDGVGGDEQAIGPIGCAGDGFSGVTGDCDDADETVTDGCGPGLHTGGPPTHTGEPDPTTDGRGDPTRKEALPPRWFCAAAPGGGAGASALGALAAAAALGRRRHSATRV